MFCAVASLLVLAWMRTAILAGGIAVVRSGVGYVEDGDEVLDVVLWRLGYRPDSAWSKKNQTRFVAFWFSTQVSSCEVQTTWYHMGIW